MVDPGAIFSLLSNIIEISKKSEEHNDELKELHQNSEILLSLIKELDSTGLLPESVKLDVMSDLKEAQKLLESPEITNWSQKLFIGVMAFFPGNKTSQFKEKNEKIFRHIHRIKALVDVRMTKSAFAMNASHLTNSVATNSVATPKWATHDMATANMTTSVILNSKSNSNPNPRPDSEEPLPENHTLKRTKTETLNLDVFEPTINQNQLYEATLVQNNVDGGDAAYEILWEGDKDIFEQYLKGNKDFCVSETLKFKEAKDQLIKDSKTFIKDIYSVGRGKFLSLIKEKSENVRSFLSLISGNHLKLVVQKIQVAIENNPSGSKPKEDAPGEKGSLYFTCEDGNGKAFEEIKKDEGGKYHFDFEFYVEDTSTNGSYILKKKNNGKKDGWERLVSKTRRLLEDGDKVGIVMDGKTHQILLLGFLFRKIQF